MKILVSLLVLFSLLAGCAVGPRYEQPAVTVPDEIRGQAGEVDAASLADRAWWEIFQDQTLQALIDEALTNAYDVRLAAWRVEEARAQAGIAGSQRFPAVQAGAGWLRGRQSAFVSPVTDTLELYDANLGLSWEIDLWGRVRRLHEGALARYLATEEAQRGVLLSLVSEVAAGYFNLRALDLQLDIARRTAEAFRDTHTLFDDRLEAGLASALETSSARAALADTRARIPELERQIAAQENALALLLGRNPGTISRGAALNDQHLPPGIPAGLPSDLLERRPDIRRAEQELVAANADAGVAVADFFPTLSLTGAFGGVAPQVSELFDEGETWSVGGGLLTPIFQGRRLKNQHRAALARWEQAKVEFERSVTNALAEVSTALVAYQKLIRVESELRQAVEASQEAVRHANSRYRSGLADYLEVLQAQQQLFPAENALARTRFDRLATLVELYRALGGGWQLDDADWAGRESRVALASVANREAAK
ncbi:MAG: efflux transporter outer membrane subunit [Thermoanaerobaculia bacterium]